MKGFLFVLFACMMACSMPDRGQEEMGLELTTEDSLMAKVIEAHGGQLNWEKAHIFSWNFFGVRKNTWNKQSGDFKTVFLKDSLSIAYNLHNKTGQAWIGGKEVNPDSLDFYLDIANQVWCNDAYWVFMPFKLKDSGVQVKYLGQDSSIAVPEVVEAKVCDVLELKFDSVGYTPQNKYKVFVDVASGLVAQWVYFKNDSTEVFTNVWAKYQNVGPFQLSTFYSESRQITELNYLDSLPSQFFWKASENKPEP
ncbi:MAG: hypothetical protein ACJAY8_001000 [Sphingobacteriales bacterium]|jgi:hypothetical protein